MNSVTIARLRDNIENMKIEPTRETILTISNVLANLLTEVERIDRIACRAADTASCLANGIQPD